jgi:hypothetical protein
LEGVHHLGAERAAIIQEERERADADRRAAQAGVRI